MPARLRFVITPSFGGETLVEWGLFWMEENPHVIFGNRTEWGQEHPFGLGIPERRQHLYLLGQTGTGKSSLLKSLLLQDIEAGRGVGLIDPHGELAQEILDHIPPWRIDDVVYFDPASKRPLGLNLFRAAGDNWHLVASGIVSAFKKIWGHSWGPRLEYVLYATLAALIQCDNSSLLGVSRMLHDERYRAWVVKQVKDPMVASFWRDEFAHYDKSFRQETIGPIQNKVGQLFLAPALRNVLGQVGTNVNFRNMMDICAHVRPHGSEWTFQTDTRNPWLLRKRLVNLHFTSSVLVAFVVCEMAGQRIDVGKVIDIPLAGFENYFVLALKAEKRAV